LRKRQLIRRCEQKIQRDFFPRDGGNFPECFRCGGLNFRIGSTVSGAVSARAPSGSLHNQMQTLHIAVHIFIGAQKVMRKSRGHFTCLHSASRRRAEAALWRDA
jgi:hypothetical protein